ncbi:acetyltransferase [Rhizobium freirei PRF 81]|uniref:Acetyltransferase n=1 Tax=Rhizobium freirei PRF 81 TaxID=363754 RepID=N6VBI6_9HYPH|nr:GNAT family N-acetyltransferase [Rhizobium freirei]ENN88417.1 acetyltransferase [Rhizobium freirei PRF 81]
MSEQHLNSIIIRPAVRTDAAVLGHYGASLMSLHSEWDQERFISAGPSTPEKYAQWLSSQVALDDVVVLVAEDRGFVIGYVYAALEGADYMTLRGPAAVIHDIFVNPDRRREGVGRGLLERAISTLSRKGAPRIILSTAYKNEGARSLFERMGFRATMIEMTKDCEAVDSGQSESS